VRNKEASIKQVVPTVLVVVVTYIQEKNFETVSFDEELRYKYIQNLKCVSLS